VRTKRRLGTFCIVLVVALTAVECARDLSAPAPATLSDQFDSFWNKFDANYSYFDYKGIDWSVLRLGFASRAKSAPTEAALVELLTLMVAPLRDVHVTFIDPTGAELPSMVPGSPANFDAGISKQLLSSTDYEQATPYFGYGRLRGIGYIRINQWADSTVSSADLDAALAHFKGDPNLIVDVRMNRGGDDSLAYKFAARFNTANRIVGYFKVRNGQAHADFDPEVARILGVRGPFQFTGRVLVLAGRSSFSANESFISAMRELPDVTIVGDTTGGGSGDPQTFDLGGGYRYTVSRWIEYTADRRVIEWNGIPPDLFVLWDSALVKQGRDPVLETALGLLGASH
jgi:Peptidase family S41/Tricorn protease C1 domain